MPMGVLVKERFDPIDQRGGEGVGGGGGGRGKKIQNLKGIENIIFIKPSSDKGQLSSRSHK